MENLIKLRKERGLTNEEMGKILGISKSRYNNWEIKRSEPSVLYLKKLADFFCVSIDYLVGAEPRNVSPIGETLTKEEKDLLTFFHGMNKVCKDAILTTAQNFYNLNANSSAVKN